MKKEHGIVEIENSKGAILKPPFSRVHLYLISNDEIKEGDWVVNLSLNFIYQAKEKDLQEANDTVWNKKVIASTDPELYKLHDNGALGQGITVSPQFSDDFIQAYINAGGIDKVMVEYESFNSHHIGNERLKLREDNTVIISQIKTSYTRADMIHALTYGVSQSRLRMSHAEILTQYKKDHL